MKKVISLILVVAVVAALSASAFAAAAPTQTNFVVTDETGGGSYTNVIGSVPKVANTASLTGTVLFKNVGNMTVNIHSIELVTSTDLAVFPFEVSLANYMQLNTSVVSVNPNQVFAYELLVTKNVSLRCRQDAAQGYYDLPFDITYEDMATPNTLVTERVVLPVLITVGSASSGGASMVPKVIATSSSTNPAPVVAGEQFSLTVTFQNKSSGAVAKNIKISLAADGTFHPVSGSSTQYIEALAPGASSTIRLTLAAKDDAAPGSYNASFSLSYEADGVKDPIVETEVVAIPVTQVPKVQVGKIQLSSTDIYIGQDLNVMVGVNNTGKSAIYNVTVAFAEPSGLLMDGEAYLGNIQSGGTGNADVYMTAVSPGAATVSMTVTYEDEKGTRYTYTDSIETSVMEKPNFNNDPVIDEPVQQKSPIGWIIAGAAALIAAGLIIFFSQKKKKKLKEQKKRDKLEARRIERELEDESERESSNV